VPGKSKCSDCLAGLHYYQIPVSCEVSGTFAPVSGLSSCVPCGGGTFSDSVSASLLHFASSSISTQPGQSVCKKCAVGTQSALPAGSVQCENCPLGRFNSLNASSSCLDCGAGAFAPVAGLSACQLCPLGKATLRRASIACTPCISGSYANVVRFWVCACCETVSVAIGIKISTTAYYRK